MDKNLKEFTTIAVVTLALFLMVLLVLGYIYQYSNINTYNVLLLFFIVLIAALGLFFTGAGLAILYIYRSKRAGRTVAWLARIGLNILFSLGVVISRLINSDKDVIRNFCIAVNNIIVQSMNKKYLPGEVLVLLPHCLQHTDCVYKITNNINNCRKCGKCCIGDIVTATQYSGVEVRVVTGGTAARNIICKKRPKLIFSVACERDLASGIADVKAIPVIGMVNERPNGPCCNTTVDVNSLRKALGNIVDSPNIADIKGYRL